MNYSQFKDFIKKSKEKIADNKNKIEYGAYTNFLKSYTKAAKSAELFINNIFINTKFKDHYQIMKVLVDPKRRNSVQSPLISKIISQLKNNQKTKEVGEKLEKSFLDPNVSATLITPNSYINRIDTFMYQYSNDTELYKEIQDTITQVYKVELKNTYILGDETKILDGFFEKVEKINEETDININLDKLVPDENEYLFVTEIGEKIDNHPYKEKIDELINENKDNKEYTEALEKANNIIVIGDDTFVKQQSNIAEYEGESSDRNRTQDIIEEIKQNKEVADLFDLSRPTRLLHIKKELTYEQIVNLEKDNITNNGIKDEKFIKDIVNLANKMKQYGFFIDKNFKAEEGNKIYSLKPLVEKAGDVKESIDNKDRDAIINNINEYKKKEKEYDELIGDVKKLNDNLNFVSNISSSRTSNIPYKYREDYRNVSKVSGLYISMGFCKVAGIDFEEFVRNPISAIKQISLELIGEKSEVQKTLKSKQNNVVEMLNLLENGLADPEMRSANNKDQSIYSGMVRAIDGVLSLHPNRKEANRIFEEFQYVMVGSIAKLPIINNSLTQSSMTFNTQTISNLLLMDEKDNPMELSPVFASAIDPITLEKLEPKFDRNKAIDNIDPEKLIEKFVDIREHYKGRKGNVIDEAITKTVTDVIERNKNLTNEEKSLLNRISAKETIPNIHITNYHTNKFIERIEKEGLNNRNVDSVLKELAETKKAYDSRNF